MQDLDRNSVTAEALAQMADTPDPRLREIMAAATRHLHDFAREVNLQPDEWLALLIESLLTELVVALVVRTRGPFYRSRPGNWLLISTVVVIAIALVLPYLPFSSIFGFVPLPASLMLGMVAFTVAYVFAVEVAKKWFYARGRNEGK